MAIALETVTCGFESIVANTDMEQLPRMVSGSRPKYSKSVGVLRLRAAIALHKNVRLALVDRKNRHYRECHRRAAVMSGARKGVIVGGELIRPGDVAEAGRAEKW